MKSELTIIKIGGKIISDSELLEKYLKKINQTNGNVIIVHGGGNIANDYFKKNNIPVKMINGRRITDKIAIEKLVMLYSGKINKNIISKLNKSEKKYIGLSGVDSNVILSKKREIKEVDYGFVGDITSINGIFLKLLIDNSIYPVICPITADKNGLLLNTNADTIATKVAIEMSKYYDLRLLYCFDKSGVLENNKVIKRINYHDYLNLLKNKTIKDGMIPKIENAFDSIKNGVKKVYIGDINIFENPNNSTEICLS